MNSIILAGGIGSRLRPLSCTRPKLLFPILNKPLLDWTFERLAKSGIKGVTLAVKFMAEVFMQRYGESSHGMKISYSKEKKSMFTGGAIKYAEELIGHEEPFLVLNGDIFTKIDFADILRRHKENGGIATIAIYPVEDPSRYGTVKLKNKNMVEKFVEKAPIGQAPSNLINAGVYVLDPEIFEYIPEGRPVSIEREVFPKLADEGKLFAHEFTGIWVDIGKPEDYLRANRIVLDSEMKNNFHEKNLEFHDVIINEPVVFDSGTIIGKESQIGPYAVIGKNSVLKDNVILENSVVFPETTILDNTSIKGVVIGEGTMIGKGVKIMEGTVIGDYVTIQDNVTISPNVTICHSKTVTQNIPESTKII
ncbi:MAG: NDP-sugar synthase [Candidatus Bathyarchaeota archaeon]